jgi:signal transduction histidine kinase
VLNQVKDDAAAHPEPLLDETQRVLDSADAALRRFARDLHDGAQQTFANAVMNLEYAQRQFSLEPETAKHYLDAATNEAESGLDELRALVSRTHPPILTHLGLAAAVESIVEGMPIPVSLDVTDQRLAPALEETVYSVVSEALRNVVKHAQATRADVRITVGTMLLTTEVSDDGAGGASVGGPGSGLLSLLDRVLAFGGELAVASPTRSGTVLYAAIPLSPETD